MHVYMHVYMRCAMCMYMCRAMHTPMPPTLRPSLNRCSIASEPGSGSSLALSPRTHACVRRPSAVGRFDGSDASIERISSLAAFVTGVHDEGKSSKDHCIQRGARTQPGRWAGGQMGRWAGGQTGRWAGGQVGRWADGKVGTCHGGAACAFGVRVRCAVCGVRMRLHFSARLRCEEPLLYLVIVEIAQRVEGVVRCEECEENVAKRENLLSTRGARGALSVRSMGTRPTGARAAVRERCSRQHRRRMALRREGRT